MLTHSYLCRDAALEGRTLTLACVPFDTPTPVCDPGTDPYIEQFDRGAFVNVVKAPNRTVLRREHSPDEALTVAQLLREDVAGLIGVFAIGPNDDGDRALADIRDGRLPGVSVGFVPGDHPGDNPIRDGVVTRQRVKSLREVSLTPIPSYPNTGVLSLRDDARRRARIAAERERWRWRRPTISYR